MPTPLAQKIRTLIAAGGPISVTDYFALCLADPQHGYYQTREPFGSSGDFVTAPEISQLFGEMIGVFIANAWVAHGQPAKVNLVEIGPGRGTMMADMLRVIDRLLPNSASTCAVHLVETSERLAAIQRETLAQHEGRITWHQSFEDVPRGFLMLVANELFDAVPIRQFVKTGTGFRERVVGIDENDELHFAAGVAGLDPALLPEDAALHPEGTIFEIAPAREAVMAAIARRLVEDGGTALAIDYGHVVSGFGDTLQAVRDHGFDPPLAHPGEADLTSHVDFERLAGAARAEGAWVPQPLSQGDFLLALGLAQRAGALGAGKDAATQESITKAAERLAGEGEGRMGELFKVMAASSPMVDLVPFRSGN